MADAFESGWQLSKAGVSFPRHRPRMGRKEGKLKTSNWYNALVNPSSEDFGTQDFMPRWLDHKNPDIHYDEGTTTNPMPSLDGKVSARIHPDQILAQILGLPNLDDFNRPLTEDEDIAWGQRVGEVGAHEGIHQALQGSKINEEENLDTYNEEYAATLAEMLTSSGTEKPFMPQKDEQYEHARRLARNASAPNSRIAAGHPFLKPLKKSMTYMDKGKRGLWDNVHDKKKRGGKAAKPGDKGYPDKKNWDKLTKTCNCGICESINNIISKKDDKPFHGYNPNKHSREGGLNAKGRAKAKKETGANLKPPVTEKPSSLKPGSKKANRRKSFCARMGGVKGPTSKEGKKTPKGAALDRWNC